MSNTINPFSILGNQHKAGLNFVIQAISGSSSSSSSSGGADASVSVDQIVEATVAYINSVYGASLNSVSDLELSIIIQDAMNGYINASSGGGLNYNSRQEFYIFQLLEGIRSTPTFGVKKYIESVEQNIVASGMSTTEQNQLLMATAIGKVDYDYWVLMEQGESPSILWIPWLQSMAFMTPNEVVFGISASMEVTLFVQKHRSNATVLDVSSTNGANAIAALAASIGVVAGLVTQLWIQIPPNAPKC